jgi:hypothetical protein
MPSILEVLLVYQLIVRLRLIPVPFVWDHFTGSDAT